MLKNKKHHKLLNIIINTNYIYRILIIIKK